MIPQQQDSEMTSTKQTHAMQKKTSIKQTMHSKQQWNQDWAIQEQKQHTISTQTYIPSEAIVAKRGLQKGDLPSSTLFLQREAFIEN